MIDNYNDLNLGTYLEIDAVLRSDREDIDQQIAIVSILSGLPEEDILALPLTEYAGLANKTQFLRETCPPATAPDRVIVGELVLIPVKDFTKINTAQYIDFQTFSRALPQRLCELLSVLLVPDTARAYNEGYNVADVQKAVASLPLPVALGLVGFFFASLSESIRASLTSLEGMTKKMPKEKAEKTLKVAEQMRSLLAGAGLPT